VFEALRPIGLSRPPIAVGFLSEPPTGLPRIDRAAGAGCAYWKHASEGHAFYTLPEDHHNCPVGAFTHGVVLPPAKAQELESLVGTMIQLQYLQSEEIPQIPHRTQPLQVVAYAPLERAAFPADVVIFCGTARQIMLLSEAARVAGVFEAGAAMGRPACAMVPHAIDAGVGVASLGCIGNRVYTGLPDDELYLALPVQALDGVMERLAATIHANDELEHFHRDRLTTLGH
jgi:uncharacterized protein (DUF169 family)